MTTRNAMNERTQNGPKGATRKSAASAKPATKAASSVYVVDPTKKQQQKGAFQKKQVKGAQVKRGSDKKKNQQTTAKPISKQQKREMSRAERDAEKEEQWALQDAMRSFKPDTPEYHHWRRIYFLVIGLGIALALIMVIFNFVIGTVDSGVIFFSGILAFILLSVAVLIDLKKVKPAKERAFYQSGSAKEFKRWMRGR